MAVPDPAIAAPAFEFDPALLERLALYARRRLQHMRGRSLEDAADYVSRAIVETLSGTRRRNPDVPMFNHLAGVISSLISHDAERAENRLVEGMPERLTDSGTYEPVDLRDDAPTPEDAMIAAEASDSQRKLAMKVMQVLSDEPDLQRFAALVMAAHSPPPPRELARSLGKPVEEIYTLRRKLQRRLAFLLPPREGPHG
ncbi:MAG: hypothetical protein EAZ99_10695 [Alphaproteobacteria bacterium]|nr:hypothetical protein [Alphaproteobacteria bacterium]TAD89221.1 MAG: hypothetical protein EAZ99_10695 [Alphaproteobacteria bacterium]